MVNQRPVPNWLLAGPDICPCGCGGRKKGSFVERTIQGLATILREEYFSEAMALKKGFLQGLDPRVKILTLIGLIGVAGFARHVETLLVMYAVILLLAYQSRLHLKSYLKRVWLVVPLFTGVMVFPALFNIVRPGDPVLTLFTFSQEITVGPWTLPDHLSITRQGVNGALILILRTGVSVSLALLLTSTTKWRDLLKALRVLFIPSVFLMTMEMTYRYIFLLVQVTTEMFEARKSRTLGPTNLGEKRKFVTGAMGVLLGKSYVLSEEIHAAMVARGYQGETKGVQLRRPGFLDVVWLVISLVLALALVRGDYYFGG